jgi:glycosyltransferase involved in cell wall biosynthesis
VKINFFSVVIPLYNKDKYILDTVKSVLEQTYPYYEIIIVNDGSSDDSVKVVEKIYDDKITLINKENSGVSDSRNLGIKTAKNDWIALLDADDIWNNEYLNEVNKMINSYPLADIIGINYDCTTALNRKNYQMEGYVNNYFKANIGEYLFNSSSVVIKKNSILAIGGFRKELKNGEDIETWYRLVKNNNVIAYSPRKLSFYKKNDSIEYERIKKNDIKTNWAYHLNFSESDNQDERKYLYKILASTFLILLKSHSMSNIFKLIRKYGVSKIATSLFFITYNKIR